MRMTMVLGVQGEFGKTLEPGESYEVGTDMTKNFARQLLDRGAGYIENAEQIIPDTGPLTVENSAPIVTGKKGK